MKARHLIPDQAFGTPLGSVVVRLWGLSGGLRAHSYTLEHLVLITAAKHSQMSHTHTHTHTHTHSNIDIHQYKDAHFCSKTSLKQKRSDMKVSSTGIMLHKHETFYLQFLLFVLQLSEKKSVYKIVPCKSKKKNSSKLEDINSQL